eukprot:g24403.t1
MQLHEPRSHQRGGAQTAWRGQELPRVFGHIGGFLLEPFGSFITDLKLPRESGRSDLDVVLVFRRHRADSFEDLLPPGEESYLSCRKY